MFVDHDGILNFDVNGPVPRGPLLGRLGCAIWGHRLPWGVRWSGTPQKVGTITLDLRPRCPNCYAVVEPLHPDEPYAYAPKEITAEIRAATEGR